MKAQQFKQILSAYDTYEEIPNRHYVNIEIRPKTANGESSVAQFDEFVKYCVHKYIVEKETPIPEKISLKDLTALKINMENEIYKRFIEKSKTQSRTYTIYKKKNIFKGYENIMFDIVNNNIQNFINTHEIKEPIPAIPHKNCRPQVTIQVTSLAQTPDPNELFYYKKFEKVNYIYKQILRVKDNADKLLAAYNSGNNLLEKKKHVKSTFDAILQGYLTEHLNKPKVEPKPKKTAEEKAAEAERLKNMTEEEKKAMAEAKAIKAKETFKLSWSTFEKLQEMTNDYTNITTIPIPINSYFKERKASIYEKIYLIQKAITFAFRDSMNMIDYLQRFKNCKRIKDPSTKKIIVHNGFLETPALYSLAYITEWKEIVRKPRQPKEDETIIPQNVTTNVMGSPNTETAAVASAEADNI